MINFVKVVRKNIAHPEKPVLTYAQAQMRKNLSLSEFAAHIAEHNSKYSKGDILAVTTEIVSCLKERLLEGERVQLGDFGTFFIKLKSDAVPESTVIDEDGNKPVLSARNIREVRVCWRPSKEFDPVELVNKAEFQQVETRKVVAESLKAKQQLIADGKYLKSYDSDDDEAQEND